MIRKRSFRKGGWGVFPTHVITIHDREQIAGDRLVTSLGGPGCITSSQENKKKNNNANDVLRAGT